jgi:hypothetical protein
VALEWLTASFGQVCGSALGLHGLKLVVELGEVGENRESVGRVAGGHVLGVQQGGDAELLLGDAKRQGAGSERRRKYDMNFTFLNSKVIFFPFYFMISRVCQANLNVSDVCFEIWS